MLLNCSAQLQPLAWICSRSCIGSAGCRSCRFCLALLTGQHSCSPLIEDADYWTINPQTIIAAVLFGATDLFRAVAARGLDLQFIARWIRRLSQLQFVLRRWSTVQHSCSTLIPPAPARLNMLSQQLANIFATSSRRFAQGPSRRCQL